MHDVRRTCNQDGELCTCRWTKVFVWHRSPPSDQKTLSRPWVRIETKSGHTWKQSDGKGRKSDIHMTHEVRSKSICAHMLLGAYREKERDKWKCVSVERVGMLQVSCWRYLDKWPSSHTRLLVRNRSTDWVSLLSEVSGDYTSYPRWWVLCQCWGSCPQKKRDPCQLTISPWQCQGEIAPVNTRHWSCVESPSTIMGSQQQSAYLAGRCLRSESRNERKWTFRWASCVHHRKCTRDGVSRHFGNTHTIRDGKQGTVKTRSLLSNDVREAAHPQVIDILALVEETMLWSLLHVDWTLEERESIPCSVMNSVLVWRTDLVKGTVPITILLSQHCQGHSFWIKLRRD
jgi:N6-adenosine-specific RNA methylase IME4